jgi:hypothetical protein
MPKTKIHANTEQAKHQKQAYHQLESAARKALNPSKDKRAKSLQDAKQFMERVESELTEAGIPVPERPSIKTLDESRQYITQLERLLAGPNPKPEPKAQLARKPVATSARTTPTGSTTMVNNAPTIAAQSVSPLASMEAIQSQIDGKTAADKVSILQKHADDRMAKLKGMNHSSPEAQGMFKQLQRIQLTQTYAIHSDPVLWANRNKIYPRDLL